MASRFTIDPDSTIALLTENLPIVPGTDPTAVPNYPDDDDSEDEVFFGNRSDKERKGKNAKKTMGLTEMTKSMISPSKSFQIYREVGTHYSSLSGSIEGDGENNDSPGKRSKIKEKRSSFKDRKSTLNDSDITAPLRELDINKEDRKRSSSARANDSFRSRSPINNRDREYDFDKKSFNHSVTRIEESEEDSKDVSSLDSSLESNWFNNTHDEMVLYERFGENYDDEVKKLSTKEQKKLKKEVRAAEAKSVQELLGDAYNEDESFTVESYEEEAQDENDHDVRSKTPVETKNPMLSVQPPTPKPRTMTPKKAVPAKDEKETFSPRLVECQSALHMLKEELKLALSPESDPKVPRQSPETRKTSPKVEHILHRSPKPESPRVPSSMGKPVLETPKHSKMISPATTPKFNTPSRYPRANQYTPSYLRPTSASKHRAAVKKDPLTNETLDVTICARHGHAHTPDMSPPKPKKTVQPPINLKNIQSPVARYIKSHPAPALIRQIKPSTPKKPLTAYVREEHVEAEKPFKSPQVFKALPEAVYRD